MDILRISTAGSVDDGKSTLIGRLLYDNNALTRDQEQLIINKTKEKGSTDLDFSALTDGLIAEREQGITIDVAHIYFSTASRKFIIADSPGHVEYTRNMVTGASHAEISLILIDARKGLLEQSYRHFFISYLLRLQAVIFCVNKMDLVGYEEEPFSNICEQIRAMLALYGDDLPQIEIAPISSLKGDNVVHASKNMTWYKGDTLNTILHTIQTRSQLSSSFRFYVQNVLHVQNENFTDYRGYTGRISSGSVAVGDTIYALPSMQPARVTEIRQYDQTLDRAEQDDSILLSIDKDIDISRGTLLVNDKTPPFQKQIKARLVWFDESPARPGDRFILQIGTKQAQAKLDHIEYLALPEKPAEKLSADELKLNDIAVVDMRLAENIFADKFTENKQNGYFILIHPATNNTSAVGFVM